MSKLTEVTKNGITVDVDVNNSGTFGCTIANDRYSADSLANLVKQIDAATKKIAKSVSVPFTVVAFDRNGAPVVKDAVATGLHSGTNNVLVTWASGVKDQFTSWNVQGDTFVPLSRDDVAEYARLHRAVLDAQRMRNEWEKAHKIDVKTAVIGALKSGADGSGDN